MKKFIAINVIGFLLFCALLGFFGYLAEQESEMAVLMVTRASL